MTGSSPPRAGTKWLTVAALVLLLVATAVSWYWVWGLLLLYWAAVGAASGETYLVETITRSQSPVLYWLICAMWGGFGLWYVFADLVWRIAR